MKWNLVVVLICFVSISVCFQRRFPVGKRLGTAKNLDLEPPPKPRTEFFDQYLDHFNYGAKPLKWKQRVLINDDFWNATGKYPGNCPGPIFFYSGNEDDVMTFWDNSGFMTNVLAPKHNALILFAEHRYFGQSLPFGNSSFAPQNVGWLSPEQAMADYAYLVSEYKQGILKNAQNCPVFSFGGSYGGMLTAWLRFKYPNVFMGGLAASAPLAFDGTGISPFAFMDTCQRTYTLARPGCEDYISTSLKEIYSLGNTESGRRELTETFKMCKPLSSVSDVYNLLNWIQGGLTGMGMLDYPYETDYGVEFPAWPVNATCQRMMLFPLNNSVAAMAFGIQTYYNNSGSVVCLDTNKDVPNWGVCCGWDYLACTEIYFPSAQRGMWFPHSTWNVTADKAGCMQQFGVELRPHWGKIGFGGFNITTATKIIFSNGLLDPWHTSGLLQSPRPELPVVVIPESGHHLDLRGPNPADPIYITDARKVEASYVEKWINEYWVNLAISLGEKF